MSANIFQNPNQGRISQTLDQRGGVIVTVINLVFGFIVTVVAFRILFLMLGANPGNSIVDAVYSWSGPFVAPFSGMFGSIEATVSQARIDFAAIIALIVYGLIASLINGAAGYSHQRAVTQ